MTTNKQLLLIYDLYWLRYRKPGEQWYELTDYLRGKLVEDGINISYNDKLEELMASGTIDGVPNACVIFPTGMRKLEDIKGIKRINEWVYCEYCHSKRPVGHDSHCTDDSLRRVGMDPNKKETHFNGRHNKKHT